MENFEVCRFSTLWRSVVKAQSSQAVVADRDGSLKTTGSEEDGQVATGMMEQAPQLVDLLRNVNQLVDHSLSLPQGDDFTARCVGDPLVSQKVKELSRNVQKTLQNCLSWAVPSVGEEQSGAQIRTSSSSSSLSSRENRMSWTREEGRDLSCLEMLKVLSPYWSTLIDRCESCLDVIPQREGDRRKRKRGHLADIPLARDVFKIDPQTIYGQKSSTGKVLNILKDDQSEMLKESNSVCDETTESPQKKSKKIQQDEQTLQRVSSLQKLIKSDSTDKRGEETCSEIEQHDEFILPYNFEDESVKLRPQWKWMHCPYLIDSETIQSLNKMRINNNKTDDYDDDNFCMQDSLYPVDKYPNMSIMFVPKIKSKLCSIEPLSDVIVKAQQGLFDESVMTRLAAIPPFRQKPYSQIVSGELLNHPTDKEVFGHPYKSELESLKWDEVLKHLNQLNNLSVEKSTGMNSKTIRNLFVVSEPKVSSKKYSAELIDTSEKLLRLVNRLRGCDIIAVDVEFHQKYSYRGIVCCVQISTRNSNFVIDVFPIRDELQILNEIFCDPNVVKIFHGSHKDVIWLQRDFGIYIVNMFDTYFAAKILDVRGGFSLANLANLYCDVKLDKKYQLADWRQRPFSEELVNYAAGDTNFLITIFECMRNQILANSSVDATVTLPIYDPNMSTTLRGAQQLISVLENSKRLCLQIVSNNIPDYHDIAFCLFKKNGFVDSAIHKLPFNIARNLVAMRDFEARLADEAVGTLWTDSQLFKISQKNPRDVNQLLSLCTPQTPFVIKRANEILAVMAMARNQVPVDQWADSIPLRVTEKTLKTKTQKIKTDREIETESITPSAPSSRASPPSITKKEDLLTLPSSDVIGSVVGNMPDLSRLSDISAVKTKTMTKTETKSETKTKTKTETKSTLGTSADESWFREIEILGTPTTRMKEDSTPSVKSSSEDRFRTSLEVGWESMNSYFEKLSKTSDLSSASKKLKNNTNGKDVKKNCRAFKLKSFKNDTVDLPKWIRTGLPNCLPPRQ